MKATPKAIEELDGWGLSLDSGLTELSGSQAGRRLPMEKVLFRNRTVLAGDDADWSRDAVKEQQIVAVSLLTQSSPLSLSSFSLVNNILYVVQQKSKSFQFDSVLL